jgi:hypothetical protein
VGSTLVDGQAPKENFVAKKSPAEFAVCLHSPRSTSLEGVPALCRLLTCGAAPQQLYKENELPGGHIIMLGPGNQVSLHYLYLRVQRGGASRACASTVRVCARAFGRAP